MLSDAWLRLINPYKTKFYWGGEQKETWFVTECEKEIGKILSAIANESTRMDTNLQRYYRDSDTVLSDVIREQFFQRKAHLESFTWLAVRTIFVITTTLHKWYRTQTSTISILKLTDHNVNAKNC